MQSISILFISFLIMNAISVYGDVSVCGAAGGSGGSANSVTSTTPVTFSAVTSNSGSSVVAGGGGKTFTANNNGPVVLALKVNSFTDNSGYTCSCPYPRTCSTVLYVTKNNNLLPGSVVTLSSYPAPPYTELLNDYAQANDVYGVTVVPCDGGSVIGGSVSASGVSFSVEMPVCV